MGEFLWGKRISTLDFQGLFKIIKIKQKNKFFQVKVRNSIETENEQSYYVYEGVRPLLNTSLLRLR